MYRYKTRHTDKHIFIIIHVCAQPDKRATKRLSTPTPREFEYAKILHHNMGNMCDY